jgi:hypothetical protein
VQKKFFRVKSGLFWLCSRRFSLFCMVFLPLLARVLWCVAVRFNIVCGAFLHGLWCVYHVGIRGVWDGGVYRARDVLSCLDCVGVSVKVA